MGSHGDYINSTERERERELRKSSADKEEEFG
jgi:hypothetical protein